MIEAHRSTSGYSDIGTARSTVVKGSIPSHHRAHQAEVHMHMQMHIEGMCATKTKNDFSYATLGVDRDGSCFGAGGAFDSLSGCPQ
jgi:hypothetical protein